MNSFVNAINNQEARTENGMKARLSSGSAVTDLFYKIGAMRKQDVIPPFVSAYVQDANLATRIALWARDVRQGPGERKIFRDILNYLVKHDHDRALRVIKKIPELGRWDDILAIEDNETRHIGYELIRAALAASDGLCAKWMPRKGNIAIELRKYLGMTPKQYRSTLVALTKVVETQMCNKDWDNINYNHVPSVASSRYKKAFQRHSPEKYKEWTSALVSTDPKVKETVKVNAGAVYPHDILKGLAFDMSNGYSYRRNSYMATTTKEQLNHILAQWEALPNWVGDGSIIPIVDTSGSMESNVGGTVRAIDVSVSLGLYLADKNRGPFKDVFCSFSDNSQLVNLNGNVVEKLNQMCRTKWGGSTNLHAAFENILNVAKRNNVPKEDMPKMVMILSDMQFNSCVRYDDSAIEMIRRKYNDAGYDIPNVIFWNIRDGGNTPVSHNDKGVALVSGFSPAIIKSVLSNSGQDLTPYNIMMKTIGSERYDY